MAFHLASMANSAFRTLLPSFLADLIWPDQRPKWKVHPTSYLDGLRGLASVVVFFCHYTEENHRSLTLMYGLNADNAPSSWIQLPFIRIIFSGRPMVHIFFVISGFVLSYKPLQTIHDRNFEKCLQVLASSAFRRPIRLFGPCVASTLLILLSIQAGWRGSPPPSLYDQFWAWVDAVWYHIIWPWGWDADLRPGFDVHLWTIPIEFVHSMLLFIVVVALCKLRRTIRQAINFGLMLYCLRCGKWAAFEFLAGMFLAELFLIKAAQQKSWECSSDEFSPKSSILPMVKTLYHISIIVAAIFLGGWPNEGAENTSGIRYLLAHTPEPFASMDILAPQKFYFAIAATLVVWSSGELGIMRRFLEGRFCQYLGRVSYALYICHGPVLETMQRRVFGHPFVPEQGTLGQDDYRAAIAGFGVKNMFGDATPAQRSSSWFFGLVLLGPLVFWTADVFWRLIDNPVISTAKKLEALCLDNTTDTESRSRAGYALAG